MLGKSQKKKNFVTHHHFICPWNCNFTGRKCRTNIVSGQDMLSKQNLHPRKGITESSILGDGGTITGVTQSKFFLAPSFIGPFFAARFASISFCLSAFFSSLRFLASSLEFIELELVSPQSFPQESEELVSVVVTGLSAECDFTPLLKLIVEPAEWDLTPLLKLPNQSSLLSTFWGCIGSSRLPQSPPSASSHPPPPSSSSPHPPPPLASDIDTEAIATDASLLGSGFEPFGGSSGRSAADFDGFGSGTGVPWNARVSQFF